MPRHLATHTGIACYYWDPAHDTVAIDANATWLQPAERREAWQQIAAVPPPVGFDPTIVWAQGPEAADCAFLRFEAHRIVVTTVGRPGLRWTNPDPGTDHSVEQAQFDRAIDRQSAGREMSCAGPPSSDNAGNH